MSDIMNFLGLDRLPQPPKPKSRRGKVTTRRPQAKLRKNLRYATTSQAQLDARWQALINATPAQLRRFTHAGDPRRRRAVPKRRETLQDMVANQLAAVGLSRKVAGWVVHLMRLGATPGEIEQRLWDHPEFKERFKPALDRRARGLPPIGPAEILAWERSAAEIMQAAGMPANFYDSYQDFQDKITAGWSVEQLAHRVNEAYLRVQQGPQVVRGAYAEMFGPSGDAALAAYFLDPKKAQAALDLEVAQAETTGAATVFGFQLSRKRADEISRAGFDYGSALERFAGLDEMQPLFAETISEEEDLDFETGVEAVFGLEGAGEATREIRGREQERQAAFGGGGGAQGSEEEGARGLGAAR